MCRDALDLDPPADRARAPTPAGDGFSRAYAAPNNAPFCTWSARPIGRQLSPRVAACPESRRRRTWSRRAVGRAAPRASSPRSRPRPRYPHARSREASVKHVKGAAPLQLRRRTPRAHDVQRRRLRTSKPRCETRWARSSARRSIKFVRLLLKAPPCDDLRDEHVIGIAERLSGHVRGPHETPIRHRVERPPDHVPIAGHQTLEVLGQLGGAQLEPHNKRQGETHHARNRRTC